MSDDRFRSELADLLRKHAYDGREVREHLLDKVAAVLEDEAARELLTKVGLRRDSLDVLGRRSPELSSWVAEKLPCSGFLPPQLNTLSSSRRSFSSTDEQAIGEQALSTLWACRKLDMFDTLALHSLWLFVEVSR